MLRVNVTFSALQSGLNVAGRAVQLTSDYAHFSPFKPVSGAGFSSAPDSEPAASLSLEASTAYGLPHLLCHDQVLT